jgi:hypothetical protein
MPMGDGRGGAEGTRPFEKKKKKKKKKNSKNEKKIER